MNRKYGLWMLLLALLASIGLVTGAFVAPAGAATTTVNVKHDSSDPVYRYVFVGSNCSSKSFGSGSRYSIHRCTRAYYNNYYDSLQGGQIVASDTILDVQTAVWCKDGSSFESCGGINWSSQTTFGTSKYHVRTQSCGSLGSGFDEYSEGTCSVAGETWNNGGNEPQGYNVPTFHLGANFGTTDSGCRSPWYGRNYDFKATYKGYTWAPAHQDTPTYNLCDAVHSVA